MQPVIRTIESKNGKNRLIVNSHGARIEELVLGGKRILAKVTRGDGKEGSSHPCIPQFGKETTTSYDLPQHGSARNKEFGISKIEDGILFFLDIEDGKYPKGLSIDQRHVLVDEEYSLRTIIKNNSSQDLPANFAEHFYWNAPNGWEGLRINGVDVTEIVKKDSNFEIKSENEILIPGQKPIRLRQKGFTVFRLWAYKNPQTNKYDNNYVCIEPIEGDPFRSFFCSQGSMVRPGQSRMTEILIKLNEY